MTKAVPAALEAFFEGHPRLALAFSGGVDSAYLLYAARACGCDVGAYFVESAFQPTFEREDARQLAETLGAKLRVIPVDILSDETVRANPADRCYHCKRALFTALADAARRDGYDAIIDGTNASDDAGDRPGMRALREMGVISPLRQCGIAKAQVREYSRRAGLSTWNKSAYACLATRVPAGTPLDGDLLRKIEAAEAALFTMGFTDFRCRVYRGAARLQFRADQVGRAAALRREIRAALMPHFEVILLDTEDRG